MAFVKITPLRMWDFLTSGDIVIWKLYSSNGKAHSVHNVTARTSNSLRDYGILVKRVLRGYSVAFT